MLQRMSVPAKHVTLPEIRAAAIGLLFFSERCQVLILSTDIDPLFTQKTLVVKRQTDQGLVEYFPSQCLRGSDACNVWCKGLLSRRHCFDFPSPIILEIPHYYCTTHRCAFSLLMKLQQAKPEDKLVWSNSI